MLLYPLLKSQIITLGNIIITFFLTVMLNSERNSKLQSVTKIMGETAIWAISCSYPLLPLNNVGKQREKLASNYVMGSQQCIRGEGDF